MVDLQSVTVSFQPRFVLRDLNLVIPAGESLALWGPNGSGKSTIFHAILDLIPFTGRITVSGKEIRSHGAAARRLMGWAPQDLGSADQTVGSLVGFVAELREVAVASAAEHLLAFGLKTAPGTAVAALSGGQRKLLSIALALLGDPPVLLLDEPTAGLDPATRKQVLTLLQNHRRQGRTLLMASHRLGDLLRLSDRVAALEDGRLKRVLPAAGMRRRLAPLPHRLRKEASRECKDA